LLKSKTNHKGAFSALVKAYVLAVGCEFESLPCQFSEFFENVTLTRSVCTNRRVTGFYRVWLVVTGLIH